jgi:hypothetical protein
MASKTQTRYDVCFYQEPWAQISSESVPLFRTGLRLDADSPSGVSIVHYGLQLVNQGKVLATSNFGGMGA